VTGHVYTQGQLQVQAEVYSGGDIFHMIFGSSTACLLAYPVTGYVLFIHKASSRFRKETVE